MTSSRREEYFYINPKSKAKSGIKCIVLDVKIQANNLTETIFIQSIKRLDESKVWDDGDLERLATNWSFYKSDGELVSPLHLSYGEDGNWYITCKAENSQLTWSEFMQKNPGVDSSSLLERLSISKNAVTDERPSGSPSMRRYATETKKSIQSWANYDPQDDDVVEMTTKPIGFGLSMIEDEASFSEDGPVTKFSTNTPVSKKGIPDNRVLDSLKKMLTEMGLSAETPENYVPGQIDSAFVRSFEEFLAKTPTPQPKAAGYENNLLDSLEKFLQTYDTPQCKDYLTDSSLADLYAELGLVYEKYTQPKPPCDLAVQQETQEGGNLLGDSLQPTQKTLDERFAAVESPLEKKMGAFEEVAATKNFSKTPIGTPITTISALKTLTSEQQQILKECIDALEGCEVGVSLRIGNTEKPYVFLDTRKLDKEHESYLEDQVSRLTDSNISVYIFNQEIEGWVNVSGVPHTQTTTEADGEEPAISDGELSYSIYPYASRESSKRTTPEGKTDQQHYQRFATHSRDDDSSPCISPYSPKHLKTLSKQVTFRNSVADARTGANVESDVDLSTGPLTSFRVGCSPRLWQMELDDDMPAPVTSHFIFLCAFQKLSSDQQGAMIYMLGFAMLVIATGGTSVLGAGVATAATTLGYAGVSMMITGAAMMFFNAPKHGPCIEQQPEKFSSCCL